MVIPSDKLTGKGFGSAIDEHDCVVRFNTHDPSDAPAEDWGTKDDIRVVNAYQVDALQQEGGSCIDPKHPTCRRVIITWETGGVDGFLGDHENAELLPQMDAEYYPNYDGKPDVHDTLRNFANENGLGVPMYGSSAYCAISVMRHPDVCGEKMTIFGIPASMEVETEGYIDPHGPANAAHCYSTEHEYFRKPRGARGGKTLWCRTWETRRLRKRSQLRRKRWPRLKRSLRRPGPKRLRPLRRKKLQVTKLRWARKKRLAVAGTKPSAEPPPLSPGRTPRWRWLERCSRSLGCNR